MFASSFSLCHLHLYQAPLLFFHYFQITIDRIILRNFTLIDFHLLAQKVHSEFLFKRLVSFVFFIRQYALDHNGMTDLFKARCGMHVKNYLFYRIENYMPITALKGNLVKEQSKTLIRLFKRMKDYIIEN